MSTSDEITCIDCGGSSLRAVYFRSPKDSNTIRRVDEPVFHDDSAYVILKCSDCESIFLHPYYFEESFAVYSSKRYFDGYFANNIHRGGGPDLTEGALGAWQERVRASNSRKKAASILRLAGLWGHSKPRVLEIGCAQGRLTKAFADLGCEASGLDISQHAVEAASKTGIPAFHGRFEDYECPDAHFDMIVSIQTFEHMASLDEIAPKIRAKLKPNGVLVIEVPNDIDGYRGKLYARPWWFVPPMHIRYFTLQNACNIFGQRGMRLLTHATLGSVGVDCSCILDWLFRKAKLDKLPGYGKARTIGTAGMRILGGPIDSVFNTARMHSDMTLVLAPDEASE